MSDDVVGSSPLLGSAGFAQWVKESFLKERPADRDLLAAMNLSDWPTIEAIRQAVERGLGEPLRMARRLALYLGHRLSGRRLREIGEAFGAGPSAVREVSRRVAAEREARGEVAAAIEAVRTEPEQ